MIPIVAICLLLIVFWYLMPIVGILFCLSMLILIFGSLLGVFLHSMWRRAAGP